jgi:hypothetical protein
LAEFSEAFTPDNMHSVCENDYTGALGNIAEIMKAQFTPACYWACVADVNPATEVVEPDCVVEEVSPGETADEEVPECLRGADGSYVLEEGEYLQPDEDTNACFVYRVDPDGSLTTDPGDDMSLFEGERYCDAEGANVEFEVVRREGFPAPAGTRINATCALSQFPQLDCPLLD